MKKKILYTLILTIFVFCLVGISHVNAVSLNLSPSVSSVSIGQTYTVNVNASGLTGKFAVSGSSNVSISTSSVWIENGTITTGGPITVTAKSAGTATITVSADSVAQDDGNEYTGSAQCTVTIKDNSGSGNTGGSNTITSLKVGNKTYSNPKTDITIGNVEHTVESIVIKPTTSNGASYTINGSSSTTVPLKTGTNVITIAVSGGKTYKIRITRLATEAEVPPNIIDENEEQKTEEEQKQENKLSLSSLKIKNFDLDPEFNSEVYSYTINVNMKEHDINKLDIDAIPSASDATVEVVGNENLIEGENIITILIKSANGEESVVYQIIVNKIDETTEVVSASPLDSIGFLSNFNSLQKMLIIGFATLILIIVIIIIIVSIRKRKKNKQVQIPYSNINEDETSAEKKTPVVQEDVVVEQTQEVKEEQNQNEKYTPLEKDKSKLMDEFFSYNQEDEENDTKQKGKSKGKGKHF